MTARVDGLVMTDNWAMQSITRDGLIVDKERARMNGICLGISGRQGT